MHPDPTGILVSAHCTKSPKWRISLQRDDSGQGQHFPDLRWREGTGANVPHRASWVKTASIVSLPRELGTARGDEFAPCNGFPIRRPIEQPLPLHALCLK